MSEEPTHEEQLSEAPKHKQISPTVMLASLVLAGILAFALLVWAQGVRTAGVRRAAFGRGIDGLAAALAIPVVELGSLRFENRGERLQKIIETVQRSGDYSSVVVTDANGNVLATTDTSLKGQTVAELAKAKAPATVKEIDGGVEASVAIYNDGSSRIGALRVKAKL